MTRHPTGTAITTQRPPRNAYASKRNDTSYRDGPKSDGIEIDRPHHGRH